MSVIFESVQIEESQVDCEALVVKNVAILGRKSKNRRTYTESALDSGLAAFEGAVAYTNHVRSGEKRNVRDILGVFRNVRKEEKLRADLHLLEKEKWLLEVAEKMPKSVGFSISAGVLMKKENGEEIIEKIESVNSIDLVDNPATVAGIFEEEEPTKMAMTDEEKAKMDRLEEEVKTLSEENKKMQEDRQKIDEEKKALEAEKKKFAVREQAEKALQKEAITPQFLKILECLSSDDEITAAINDRKSVFESSMKLRVQIPQQDNTMPQRPVSADSPKFTKEQIKEELKKGGY